MSNQRRLYRLDLPGGSHVYRYLTDEVAARDYPDAVLDEGGPKQYVPENKARTPGVK